MPGVDGQDNPNPLSGFGYHMIVRLSFNNKFYDPSYGNHNPYVDVLNHPGGQFFKLENPETGETYENINISGFYVKQVENIVEEDYDVDFDGDGTVEDFEQTLHYWVIKKNKPNDDEVYFKAEYQY